MLFRPSAGAEIDGRLLLVVLRLEKHDVILWRFGEVPRGTTHTNQMHRLSSSSANLLCEGAVGAIEAVVEMILIHSHLHRSLR